MEYWAHKHKNENSVQLLLDHLTNTAKMAKNSGAKFDAAIWAEQMALLHDLGKYSQNFQARIRDAAIRCDHSSAGAQKAYALYNKSIARILSYGIAGHHTGLLNAGTDDDTAEQGTLCGRLKKDLTGSNDYSAHNQEVSPAAADAFRLPRLSPAGFSFSFFVRMLFSCLTDADFLDTENFMESGAIERGGYPSMQELSFYVDKKISSFEENQREVDKKRTEILKDCIAKASLPQGFFTLTVPTGGGKTWSSMAFAIRHALEHNLDRIIYVIPFTSIIEQNAAVFKKALGESNVLEHHSNFEFKQDDEYASEAETRNRLACENWDIPIVVTTNVQFFESLFSNKSSKCRKLHNIAKSVIIFDEAQMLPTDFLKPCLYAMSELVSHYRSSIVLCTATQPSIGKYLPNKITPVEIAENTQENYAFFRGVNIYFPGKINDEELVSKINHHHQALCIVNTRAHAAALFDRLSGENKYHLSTLMCPAHRTTVIGEIKDLLKEGKECLVVSTSLLEAGVDIDFPVVYRALAGLDSIIQSAGRCNRERKNKYGQTFVFEPDSVYQKTPPAFIKRRAEIARRILEKYEDPICIEAIQMYFDQLYELSGEAALDRENIIGMLEERKETLSFDFAEVSKKFKLIKEETVPIVIPFDEVSKKLLKEAKHSPYPAKFARKLQPYTVNVYEAEFKALYGSGAISQTGGIILVLEDMNLYHSYKGLQARDIETGNAIFVSN